MPSGLLMVALDSMADGEKLRHGASQPRAVLQTYTVSLGEAKRDIELWRDPLQAELKALEDSGTIRRVKVSQLSSEPGYNMMTVAPAKIVPTIKSPVGKKKIRIVVCGNLVGPADHIKDVGNYAENEGSHQVEVPMTRGQNQDPGGDCWQDGSGSSGGGPSDLFAGGVDATALRCVLRKAAGEGWEIISWHRCPRSIPPCTSISGQKTTVGN